MTTEIGQRLGVVPFVAEGKRSLEGFIERRDGSYRVRLVLRDADGAVAWTRELASTSPDCQAATQAAALAVTALLALEVEAAQQHVDARDAGIDAEIDASDASAPAPPRPRKTHDAAAPLPERAVAPGTELELSAVGAVGLLPSASIGAGVFVTRLLARPLRLEVGGYWLAETKADDERFGFGLVAAKGALCGEKAFPAVTLDLCGGLHVGVVHAVVFSGLTPSRPGERAWLGISAGPRVRVPIVGPLELSMEASVVMNALRYQFVNVVGGSDSVVFEQPLVAGQAQLGLGLAFP
ncbi:hypothetical protein [Labilithrix luteola]|nr:hypothetical protein [Labilithrix luteola]